MVKMQSVQFTDVNSRKIQSLEKDIAYFYGVPNPEPIAEHYMNAIAVFEASRSQEGLVGLREKTTPFLSWAYQEVMAQTGLTFDVEAVAALEYDLIYAQATQQSFENICALMTKLYQAVFKVSTPSIYKAAQLRTFLYQYKINTLQSVGFLSDKDIEILLALGKASEGELLSVQTACLSK